MSGRQTSLAVALVFGAVVSVQCGSAIATELFDRLGPEGSVFLRSALGGAVFLLLCRPSARILRGPGFVEILKFAFVLFAMNSCFYAAIDTIPLGAAVTIEFVGPLGLAILGSRHRLDLLWAFLAAAGILLLSGGVQGDLGIGVLFALGSGLFWAAYIVQSAVVGAKFPGVEALAVAITISALFGAPLGIAEGGAELLDPKVILISLAVGILSTVIPYACEMEALRRISKAVFGILMSLQPAIAALVGLLLLSQGLSALEVFAIALVVVASAGALSTGTSPPPVND
ncbi:MAG: EamA family transporter [Actinobacteria bacterium]|nr:EamA family transporter [Actinomycetota bacterium]